MDRRLRAEQEEDFAEGLAADQAKAAAAAAAAAIAAATDADMGEVGHRDEGDGGKRSDDRGGGGEAMAEAMDVVSSEGGGGGGGGAGVLAVAAAMSVERGAGRSIDDMRAALAEAKAARERGEGGVGGEGGSAAGGAVVRVRLRLPNGSKIDEIFGGGDAIDLVFDLAEVACVDGGDGGGGGGLTLVSQFPRRRWTRVGDGAVLLGASGLGASVMLHVEGAKE